MKKHKKHKKNGRKTIEQRKGGGEKKKEEKKIKIQFAAPVYGCRMFFFFLSKEEIASISKRLRDG